MNAFDVPVHVEESHGLARDRDAIRIGIPFAPGTLFDPGLIGIVAPDGAPVPGQARSLARWPDGSVQWLLADALVRIGAQERVTLRVRGGAASDARPNGPASVVQALVVRETQEHFEIDTGVATFVVPRHSAGLPGAVKVGGAPVLGSRGCQLRLRDAAGQAGVAELESLVLEESGPVRATLAGLLRVSFSGRPSPLSIRTRLVFVAGSGSLRIELQIRNSRAAHHPGGLWDLGDPGSVLLRELAIEVHPHAPQKLRWYADDASGTREQGLEGWSLYQDSSGGEHWDSDNHLTASGKLSVSFRGYEVRSGGALLESGLRATPCVWVVGEQGSIAASAEDFWQNFPRALGWSNGALSIGLFPAESVAGFELQGGERKRHVALLEFGPAQAPAAIERAQKPLAVWLDPQWVEHSGAVAWLAARSDTESAELRAYVDSIIEGPRSFFAARELIDEYGWRNFGDVYADHEAIHHRGPKAMVSHYNNQYDFIQAAAAHFLRSGDSRWHRLMVDAARHTIDIDIYHTQEDRPAFNGGLFWHTDHYLPAATCTHRTYSRHNAKGGSYGGGPSNEHNYTTGLMLYYYLTGDVEAREAVLGLAEWVLAMDDGARNVFAMISTAPTGLASKTVDQSYHGPGRGAGNSVNALLDAYALSGERRFMAKAEELIQRCIHPADRIESLRLDEPEHRWSYLVFLQVLGKYLEVKARLGETDYHFYYARDSLLHYAAWMLGHEVPYKQVLHKVLLPTETWPAHDIRKCHVLHLAARYATGDRREAFRGRAAFFFERCIADVLSFETAYLARPRVILSVYGHVHAYFEKHGHESVPEVCTRAHSYTFGLPQQFVSQRRLLKSALRDIARRVRAEIVRILRDKTHDLLIRLRAGRAGGKVPS